MLTPPVENGSTTSYSTSMACIRCGCSACMCAVGRNVPLKCVMAFIDAWKMCASWYKTSSAFQWSASSAHSINLIKCTGRITSVVMSLWNNWTQPIAFNGGILSRMPQVQRQIYNTRSVIFGLAACVCVWSASYEIDKTRRRSKSWLINFGNNKIKERIAITDSKRTYLRCQKGSTASKIVDPSFVFYC